MKELTREQVIRLSDDLEGTCKEIWEGLNAMELESDDYDMDSVESQLSEFVERCEGCEWWFEICELEDFLCDQCRPKGAEENDE